MAECHRVLHAMMLFPSVSDHDTLQSREDELSVATGELTRLLLQRAKLKADIGRLRRFLSGIAQHHRIASSSRLDPRNPERVNLRRACRIALVEADEPASAEAIYDRIARRGSLSFAQYKLPLRAIRMVLNSMASRGEASRVDIAGRRFWRWCPPSAEVEQFESSECASGDVRPGSLSRRP